MDRYFSQAARTKACTPSDQFRYTVCSAMSGPSQPRNECIRCIEIDDESCDASADEGSLPLSICPSIHLSIYAYPCIPPSVLPIPFFYLCQDSIVPESILEGAAKKPAPDFDGFTFVADSHLK